MSTKLLVLASAFALMFSLNSASAALVDVTSYSMNNGDGVTSSSFLNYWDGNYGGSGSKTTDNAPLSGGVGALTDGVIATQRWDQVSNLSGTGEYVGWFTANPDGSGEVEQSRLPNITFSFTGDHTTTIHSISFYVDASNNGLVGAPSSVEIAGTTYAVGSGLTVASFVSSASGCASAATSTALGGATCYDKLTVNGTWSSSAPINVILFPEILQTVDAYGFHVQPWIMVSEVQFETTAVPEPSTWMMMLIGFVGMGFMVRHRNKNKVLAAA